MVVGLPSGLEQVLFHEPLALVALPHVELLHVKTQTISNRRHEITIGDARPR